MGAKHARRKLSAGAPITVIMVLVLAVLLISSMGDVLAKNLLAPLLGTPAPAESAVPVPTVDGAVRSSVTLPELKLFCVQTSAYALEQGARDAAEALRQRGGAGYVLYDGVYRVLASAYTERTQADSVAANLAEQYTALVYTLASGTVTLSVTATPEQTRTLTEAYETYCGVVTRLLSDSIELDKGEISLTAMRAGAAEAADELDAVLTRLDVLAHSAGDCGEISSLISLFKDAKKNLLTISSQNSQDPLPFCGEIRYNLIVMAQAYCAYIANVI